MSSQTDSETVPCCSLSFQVHFTVNIGKSRRSRSTVIPSQAADVRKRGPVRIEEYGANRSWFFKANWLELTNEQLLIYPSANRKPSFIASTRDILKVERTDIRRYGLIITTTNQQHLLTFKNEKELYDWFDKLYESDNGVSAPWNFVHHIHVGADAATGQFTGLPVGWRKALDLPPVYEASTTKKSDKVGVNIRIGTPSQDDPGHVSTTLSVYPDTPLSEVLDRARSKAKVDEKTVCLLFMDDDSENPLALDGTVANLQGRHNLVLLTFER